MLNPMRMLVLLAAVVAVQAQCHPTDSEVRNYPLCANWFSTTSRTLPYGVLGMGGRGTVYGRTNLYSTTSRTPPYGVLGMGGRGSHFLIIVFVHTGTDTITHAAPQMIGCELQLPMSMFV